MKKDSVLGFFLMGTFLVTAIPGMLSAEEEAKEPKRVMIEQKIAGNIAYVDSNFMSVEYAEDKDGVHEMAFKITQPVKLLRVRDFGTLKAGDRVEVAYEETQEEYEAPQPDGSTAKAMKVIDRKPKSITFVRSARQALVSES